MKSKFLIVFFGVLLTSCFINSTISGYTQTDGPQGRDFEGVKISEKKVIQQWFQGKKEDNPHYNVEITSNTPYSGKECALLQSSGKPDSWEFGSFAQFFDAKPFRGMTIRFKAAVRVESTDGAEGSIWIRVDKAGEKTTYSDRSEDPITSNQWKEYEIKGLVSNDAEFIYIGCLLKGKGKLFIDAVQFDILTGKDALSVESLDWSKPVNLDFEAPELNIKRGGWFTPLKKYVPNYDANLISQGAYSGKQYAALYSTGKPTGREFGNLMQAIDATPYRGKTVRFRAAARMGSIAQSGHAQMWLRVDRPNRLPGFFDNMYDRPITATDWKEYDITGTVDTDATEIYIGYMLIGEGKADFDAVRFEVVDEHPPTSSLDSKRNGWMRAGSAPRNYIMGTDDNTISGGYINFIRYTSSEQPAGFGTYMKMHEPGNWAGKKLRMTGFVRTENVENWCGMWCRVDGDRESNEVLDFDNMGKRPIKGTTDWQKYEITVNVPKRATAIAYGVLVNGKGVAYFKDINFEVVGEASN